jgi:hypothetical protein
MARWLGRASRGRKDKGREERGLVPAPPPERGAGPTQNDRERARRCARWEKLLRQSAGRDARFTRDGIHFAACYDIPPDSFASADDELEARENIASCASIPDTQVSRRTRDALIASAARGEETYAYPPISPDPRTVDWNMWYRGRRINIREFEEATGGTVDSRDIKRLPPSGSTGSSGK